MVIRRKYSYPYVYHCFISSNCLHETEILFLSKKRFIIGKFQKKFDKSNTISIDVDKSIYIHYTEACVKKFVNILLRFFNAIFENYSQLMSETLCDGVKITKTINQCVKIEKKNLETNDFKVIAVIPTILDLKEFLIVIRRQFLFPIWSCPNDKEIVEKLVTKCIESKKDIFDAFKSLELCEILQTIDKESKDILHRNRLYFEICQNLEFLQLWHNLIPFRDKKKDLKSKSTQTASSELPSISKNKNPLIPDKTVPKDALVINSENV